jgi:hypothetical protein
MASEIHYSPIATVRWAHLITAREQLDPSKPKAFTAELVLENSNPAHAEFLAKLDGIFVDTHGAKKRRSDKGQPWKPDKENSNLTVVKFKALEFVRDDGTKAKGPRIIDAKKKAWDDQQIGNNSTCKIAFTTYGWERPEGVGLSLQPTTVQVITLVPLVIEDGFDGFGEEEGYEVTQASGFNDEFDEFSDEAPF